MKFLNNYKRLDLPQREQLLSDTTADVRSRFMRNYLEHFERVYECSNAEEQAILIENSLLLISLDNFEHNSTTSCAVVKTFLKTRIANERIFQSILSSLFDSLPKRTTEKLTWLMQLR